MEKLIDKVKKYKYVSFDIFDTLIKRNVNKPNDLFVVIEKKYGIDNFFENRVECEKKARKLIHDEISLDDIYNNMKKFYLLKDVEKLKKLEIYLECKLCVFNQEIKELYDYCLKTNKVIIITSDMYLPQKIIEKILSKNGIKYNKLYLSSTLKMTKQKGDLFKYVLDDMKINCKDLIHIGDNKKSDYISARKNGINSIIIPTIVSRLSHYNLTKDNIDDNLFRTFINNSIDKKNYFYNIGYEILGPFLYLFCNWLNKNFKKNDIKQILFFSRDGLIIKKIYDLMFPDDTIKTTYFYASRRALIVPSLMYYNNIEEMIKNMYLSENISIKSLLENLGVENCFKNLNDYGLSLNENIKTKNIFQNVQLKKFLDDIYPNIIENSKNEKNNFIKYFSNKVSEKRVAIVDIGWFGNMQNAIQKILFNENINIYIEGFYTGLVPSSLNQKKYNMSGFIFDANHDQELHEYEKRFNCIFEMMFSANHGSVKKYDMENNDVKIIFKEFENIKNQEAIAEYQIGARQFVENFIKDDIKQLICISKVKFIDALFDFGTNPNLTDAENFGNLNFDSGSKINYIAKPKKIYKYIIKPKKIINDFNDAYWKIGFLKRLIKININYNKLYDILRSFKRR